MESDPISQMESYPGGICVRRAMAGTGVPESGFPRRLPPPQSGTRCETESSFCSRRHCSRRWRVAAVATRARALRPILRRYRRRQPHRRPRPRLRPLTRSRSRTTCSLRRTSRCRQARPSHGPGPRMRPRTMSRSTMASARATKLRAFSREPSAAPEHSPILARYIRG
jgi:hypothetical protein